MPRFILQTPPSLSCDYFNCLLKIIIHAMWRIGIHYSPFLLRLCDDRINLRIADIWRLCAANDSIIALEEAIAFANQMFCASVIEYHF